MEFNIRRRLNLGFTVAILLVLVVGIISLGTFRRQHNEALLVKHTYQVVNQLVLVQKLLIDMETGRRGFRSTNEKKFLQPYYEGTQQVGPGLKDLYNLISDNPEQQKRLRVVETQVEDLLLFWRGLGEDASRYTRERITEIMFAEKTRMDRVRDSISRMIAVEDLLLSQREKDSEQAVAWAQWELVIGILLILVIVVLLIFQILKEFKTRTKAEESLRRNYKELTLVNQENAQRNWLLSGLAKVNDILQSHNNINELSQVVLDALIKYLGLNAGAFYIYDADNEKLLATAGSALPVDIKKEYVLREGFVGQAAVGKEPLVVNSIPSKYATLQSSVINVDATHAIYAPLHHDNELKGVIEVLSFNPVTEEMIRLLKMTSNNISVALHSMQSRERVMQLLEQVQQQKEALEHQQEELRQTNEELTVQAEALQSSEEELRVQEEELRQINAELKEKNNTIENARNALSLKAAELEATSKYKSEFLANMSHELRTPLNSVLILAKLLADNKDLNLTDKQVAHANIIYKSGSDLLQLINDILDLSKIEAGKVDLHIENIPVKNIASDLQQLFAVVADEKGIRYSVTIDQDVPAAIKTDKQKVEQVLKNLLSNAFKFTAKDGEVALGFSCKKVDETDYLAISVKDSGIGIAKEKQQVIFEAFQQADGSTSRKFGGTGLGLSISKELVRILKGRVQLDSDPGKGSTFTVLVPASGITPSPGISQEPKIQGTVSPAVIEQNTVPDQREVISSEDRSMLVIEDDQNFAGIIKEFAIANGYKTIVALSGDEGLLCARKYRPSAIILDMNLPGINGESLLKIFKSDPELKHIPVHIISAADDGKLMSAGALAFLRKPVEKEDLERAFSLIGEYLQSAVKRVLVLSENHLEDDLVKNLAGQKKFDIVYEQAFSVSEALGKLKDVKYDCIIADIDKNVEQGIQHLGELNERLLPAHIPIIIYLDRDITLADELELKKVADVVVRKSSLSNHRLLDELELFLYKVNKDGNGGDTKYNGKAATADVTLQDKKVLLVDDDMRNIFALSAALEQEQMQVVTANDGQEAVETLKANNDIDIVLMDIMMPEMDGYEAMRHIRSELKMTKLPIIALTAKAMTGDKEKCMEAGASDYISKPVDTKKLISLMRVWLS